MLGVKVFVFPSQHSTCWTPAFLGGLNTHLPGEMVNEFLGLLFLCAVFCCTC